MLLALLSWPISQAKAQDVWVVATVASYHAERDRGYNEQNLGFGVEVHHVPEMRSGFGFYKNSYYRESLYLFWTWVPMLIGDVRFGMTGGLVSGYEDHPVFVVIPTAAYETGRYGVNVGFAPSFIGLQVKYRIE